MCMSSAHLNKTTCLTLSGVLLSQWAPDCLTAVIITCPVRINYTLTLSCSSHTFHPNHNCLYEQTHLDLHSNFSHSRCTSITKSTFTNLTSICPQGVKCLECGKASGGGVNNCNPESTQMPHVPLRCAVTTECCCKGWRESSADQTDGLEQCEVIQSSTKRFNLSQSVCSHHFYFVSVWE